MKTALVARIALALAGLWTTAAVAAEVAPTFVPYVLKGPNGAQAEGELGAISVPEVRANPNARRITIRFVRLRATSAAPGYPIVYLAGGPGGSAVGNGQGVRFAFFNRLREAGDVILLEQRGTGLSDTLPLCETKPFDPSKPLDRANFADTYRGELARCIAFWRAGGADVAGYNTWESAADLEDLRRALGAEQLNLVGLSYGTHLGMAALKRGVRVHRAVFAGLEGLDQTVKLPAHFDAFLARVAAALRADPKGASYGDLIGTMRRVHARLEREPVTVTVGGTPVRLGAFGVQILTSFLFISDPERIAQLPGFYAMMDSGNFQLAGETLLRAAQAEFSRMRGMPQLMDLASGVSRARGATSRAQAATALLGEAGNFPMPQIADVAPALVLPDAFRAPLATEVPTLLVMGTMDGRTPIESQEELLPQFRRATRLTAINGGHNIFEQSEDVQREIVRFLLRGDTGTGAITLAPVSFK
jgi:pimeloyl-ACP methyl ester carboxylesterase